MSLIIYNFVTVNYKIGSSIIMKSKTNFTYKEFISKLSNVPASTKNNISEKSPSILKNCNRNT